MTVVRAFPRLHVGLVDLGNATLRKHGGAGFVLNCTPIEVAATRGRPVFSGLHALDRRGQLEIVDAVRRLSDRYEVQSTRIAIRKMPPQHVGLGTKTALILATLKACEMNGGVRIASKELQRLSGRGGVSGIGIHGFFRGGFLVDGGHRVDSKSNFVPSSARDAQEIPPLISRSSIPRQWRFALFIHEGHRYSGDEEIRFFRSNTPVPQGEVKDSLAFIHHGVVPAVIEGSIADLRLALQKLHSCGFKRRELEGQTMMVRRLFSDLASIEGCAVGMSSMGPLTYVVIDAREKNVLSEVLSCGRRHGARLLALADGRNQGYEVIG